MAEAGLVADVLAKRLHPLEPMILVKCNRGRLLISRLEDEALVTEFPCTGNQVRQDSVAHVLPPMLGTNVHAAYFGCGAVKLAQRATTYG